MPNYEGFVSISQFHASYLKEMLREYNIRYRKARPKEVLKENYFNELLKRVKDTEDLRSFFGFVEFCGVVRRKILEGTL